MLALKFLTLSPTLSAMEKKKKRRMILGLSSRRELFQDNNVILEAGIILRIFYKNIELDWVLLFIADLLLFPFTLFSL